ncbi:choice-of-anchor tandem repeat GloVer-containing protein [Pseudochryseolinea flava]|uniref:Secretion system C-terminal sorting domain-containing protein n=1 Tax=Pseudochryseolinea flava TaxID=2059302 RepID=A0A364XW20_9BACT|nr:choice-of-anchor tandem repeat GloVer-containing protein [Pseudochryseolinea flava]RAV98323.1 hypothetical protein DQQ10_24560 [Pseudochryseolinea flava]
MFRKGYIYFLMIAVWLCSITIQAQERVWVLDRTFGILYSMNTEGTDLVTMSSFNEPDFGASVGAFDVVKYNANYNGQVLISTTEPRDGENLGGAVCLLGPTGLTARYNHVYGQDDAATSVAAGASGIYIPLSRLGKWSGLRKFGYASGHDIYKKVNTDLSNEYRMIALGDTIFGVSSGDSNNQGFVYRITPNQIPTNAAPDRIYSFGGGANGARPVGKLHYSNGFLFGYTSKGGLNNKGIFFKVKTDGTGFEKLFDLASTSLVAVDENDKCQTLLDVIAKGYVPATSQDGNYFVGGEDGLYKISASGHVIARLMESQKLVDDIAIISPQFQHPLKIQEVENGATNVPTIVGFTVPNFDGAEYFQLEVSTSPDFSTGVERHSSHKPYFNLVLNNATTYYTRARANIWAYWGEVVSFSTVDVFAPKPERLYVSNDSVHFSVNVGDASDYHFFRDASGEKEITSFFNLNNNEKIFTTREGDSQGRAGKMYKISGNGMTLLYDLEGSHTGVNQGPFVHYDGHIYALEYSAVSVHLLRVTRYKTDGTGVEYFPASHPGIQRYAQIAGTSMGIYGVSPGQGANNGFIFRVKPDMSGVEEVFTFSGGVNGSRPKGAVVVGKDGYLYGTTRSGGLNNAGVIYRVDHFGNNYSVIHHFNGINGKNPETALIRDEAGVLYGSTTLGGKNGYGVLFKINQDGTGFQKLIDYFNTGGKNLSSSISISGDDVYAIGGAGLFKVKKGGTGYHAFGISATSFKQMPTTWSNLFVNPGNAGETDTNVTFTTNQPENLVTLEVSKSATFSNDVQKFSGIGPISVTGLEYGQVYYIRPRSNVSPAYGYTSYIKVRSVRESSIVISPADQASNVGEINGTQVDVDVTINDVVGAEFNALQMSTDLDFTNILLDYFFWIDAPRTVNFPLQPNTTYYVRVRSDLSPFWGPTTTFTTRGPAEEEEEDDQLYGVYPNPSTSSFMFIHSDVAEQRVVLTDLMGNILYRNDALGIGEPFGEDLSPGIYILTAETPTGIKTVRLVKE